MQIFVSKVNQKLGELLVSFLPLCFALMLLRVPELFHELHESKTLADVVENILLNDLLALVKGAIIWLVFAAPILLIRTTRVRAIFYTVFSGIILILEASLIYYFQVAGVPLGADIFSYSFQELLTVATSTSHAVSVSLFATLAFGLGLILTLPVLHRRFKSQSVQSHFPLVFVGLVLAGFSYLPSHTLASEEIANIGFQRKIVFFVEDSFTKLSLFSNELKNIASYENPFSHEETTPDTLGQLLSLDAEKKPHFVFIIVEGLGRNFSGSSARLGSFTPFLDALAEKSLYWENFLASQGRTFAVLPSVFGSLPFGAYGQNSPKHHSLLSLLKSEGYALQYFSGSNLEFDQQGQYLSMEGVDSFVSEQDFVDKSRKVSEWGYADLDLFRKLADKSHHTKVAPTLTIVQTMSMHTPFNFPEIDVYRKKVDSHLDLLKIPTQLKESYLKQKDIYASILYADDALKQYFAAMEKSPDWRNTIVVITGDHRLPEIPMQSRIERYQVPLLISSPMIHAPKRFKSISSHFDIAPSVVALLSNRYQLKTPLNVSWMGTGLDVNEEFRNLHRIPIKQTKTELSDYVSGQYYLGKGQLYKISEGLQIEPIENSQIKNTLSFEFNQFLSSLSTLSKSENLMPIQKEAEWRKYDSSTRSLLPRNPIVEYQGVSVAGAKAVIQDDGYLHINADFKFVGMKQSTTFVPLFVMTNLEGKELAEAYGNALQLMPGEMQKVQVKIKLADKNLIHGEYFVAAVVSHPETGKSIGQGQYHVPVTK